MKNTLVRLVGLSLLFISFFSHTAFAQMTEAQRGKLRRLSDDYKIRERNTRIEVEQFAMRNYLPLEVRDTSGKIIAIFDRVVDGQAIYIGPDNAVSQTSLSADDVKTGGSLRLNLTGAGQTLGIWEAGGTVRASHQEFGGRVTNLDGTASSDHATHVAGTMIASGVDPAAEGFAEAANLRCYDATGDNAEMASEAANTPIRVSNHSYGDFAGWDFDASPMVNMWRWYGNNADATDWKFGAYDAGAHDWDDIAVNAPFYLIVKSAGNDRNDNGPAAGATYLLGFGSTTSTTNRNPDGGANGFDCIPTQGTAKNILTVGAVNPVTGGGAYNGPTSVTMSTFSGWGPTDDGRVKPDVVADGVGLYSASNTADNAYTTKDGTSMAAPSTSGSVGLLLEHWQNELGGIPRAATMKALLINEADEVGANNGPDYSFGWGQINVADAAQIITIHSYEGCDQIVEGSVAAGATFSYTFSNNSGQPLKVTLVWNDPASGTTNGGTLNPAGVNYLVNDLDLRLDGNGSTFLPWILDPANPANAATTGDNGRDNVEQVLVLSPMTGDYTIRVVAPATLTDGPQQFSLVFSGADATADNATYSLLAINDAHTYAVRQNLTFGPSLTITSPGDVKAYAGQTVRMVPGFHAQAGSRFLARILPGGGCGMFSGALKSDNYPGSKPLSFSEDRQQTENPENNVLHQQTGHLQISPNPTLDVFSLRFDLAVREPVSLQISDAFGQVVHQWYNREIFDAGEYSVESNNLHLEPGIYYVEMETPSARSVQKLVKVNQ
ncbi:MAG TPA: S8 family serine peptidase [Saprospiraceae bacterium]|nr:S8 family serine peptidase [Saprospiraceae bacterium]